MLEYYFDLWPMFYYEKQTQLFSQPTIKTAQFYNHLYMNDLKKMLYRNPKIHEQFTELTVHFTAS